MAIHRKCVHGPRTFTAARKSEWRDVAWYCPSHQEKLTLDLSELKWSQSCHHCGDNRANDLLVKSGGHYFHYNCPNTSPKKRRKQSSLVSARSPSSKRAKSYTAQASQGVDNSDNDNDNDNDHDYDNGEGNAVSETETETEDNEAAGSGSGSGSADSTRCFAVAVGSIFDKKQITRRGIWKATNPEDTGKCSTCSRLLQSHQGWEAGHIDSTRKITKGYALPQEAWNCVVQCRDCNGKLGAHNMLDWMASLYGYPRGQIKPLLLKRLYASYSQAARVFQGMPSLEELRRAVGTGDLAEFVQAAYQPKHVDNEIFGYRKILKLTPHEQGLLNKLFVSSDGNPGPYIDPREFDTK